jgi:hypothetical protein
MTAVARRLRKGGDAESRVYYVIPVRRKTHIRDPHAWVRAALVRFMLVEVETNQLCRLNITYAFV